MDDANSEREVNLGASYHGWDARHIPLQLQFHILWSCEERWEPVANRAHQRTRPEVFSNLQNKTWSEE